MVVHKSQTATVLPTPSPRGGGGISAHMIESGILNPAMDGRVLNLQQYDPSPEVDSDLERALEANRRGDRAGVERWIRSAMAANHTEGQMLCTVAGHADEATVAMRSVRTEIKILSGRRLVAKLTGPLGQLLEGPNAEAARVVTETVRSTPLSMLTTKQVRHQLGKRKCAVLDGFLGEAS